MQSVSDFHRANIRLQEVKLGTSNHPFKKLLLQCRSLKHQLIIGKEQKQKLDITRKSASMLKNLMLTSMVT